MTERSEITNILQRELSHMPDVYGEQEKGSVDLREWLLKAFIISSSRFPAVHLRGPHGSLMPRNR
jgi:hypothetical protein